MSLKSYAPVLFDVYKLGSEKEFVFNCKSEKAAQALRHRLHALRREMRKENHWLVPVAERVKLSIRGNLLVAHPADSELVPELEEALLRQGFRKEKVK